MCNVLALFCCAENGFEVVNSLSEGLEGIPTWLDLHSVQRDKGSVKEWQEYIIF